MIKFSFSEHTKEQVFREIYEEYYGPFCLYAKRFIVDMDTRKDIVSEIFTALWYKVDSNELQSDTILGYIKSSVRNSCLNYLKHQEYERNYATLLPPLPAYEMESESVNTLDELYKMLHDILNKLPDDHRMVFTKSFFEGKTHAEIAEEMNLSVKSVNRYKQKTMEVLRRKLKGFAFFILLLKAFETVN